MTRRIFLAMLGAAPVAASEPWNRRPFPDWTPEVVDRLLTDSPWARQLTVAFEFQSPPERLRTDFGQIGLPGGVGLPTGGPDIGRPRGPAPGGWPRTTGAAGGDRYPKVRTEAYLTVRWSSALPVRQALALERWGREGLHHPKAEEYLLKEQPEYVVEIFGLPVILEPQRTGRLEEGLAKTASLLLKARAPIRASEVHVPEYGNHLSAEMHYPRIEAITPDDGTLEFAAEAGPVKIAHGFKLKAMVYQGRLAL